MEQQAELAEQGTVTEPQEAALLSLDTCTIYCLSKARLSRVEQQGTDRAAGSSAQRCFYLYILFVKGAGLSRELFFDVYSISASSFFFTIKYREYTLEFSGPLFLPP